MNACVSCWAGQPMDAPGWVAIAALAISCWSLGWTTCVWWTIRSNPIRRKR